LLRPLDGGRESLWRHRFVQIIDRPDIERAERVMLERGDEHDARYLLTFDGGDHAKSTQLGHLDVDEEQVGAERRDQVQCIESIFRLTNQLETRRGVHQRADPFPHEWFIVHDDGAKCTGRAQSRNSSEGEGASA
jgi:hypothetical protein